MICTQQHPPAALSLRHTSAASPRGTKLVFSWRLVLFKVVFFFNMKALQTKVKSYIYFLNDITQERSCEDAESTEMCSCRGGLATENLPGGVSVSCGRHGKCGLVFPGDQRDEVDGVSRVGRGNPCRKVILGPRSTIYVHWVNSPSSKNSPMFFLSMQRPVFGRYKQ